MKVKLVMCKHFVSAYFDICLKIYSRLGLVPGPFLNYNFVNNSDNDLEIFQFNPFKHNVVKWPTDFKNLAVFTPQDC